MRKAILLFTLCFAYSTSFANYTGNELKRDAQDHAQMIGGQGSYDTFNSATFVGYVNGASDVLRAAHLACPPRGVQKDQILDVIKSYMRTHPEELNKTAYVVVTNALLLTWPCKK